MEGERGIMVRERELSKVRERGLSKGRERELSNGRELSKVREGTQ